MGCPDSIGVQAALSWSVGWISYSHSGLMKVTFFALLGETTDHNSGN